MNKLMEKFIKCVEDAHIVNVIDSAKVEFDFKPDSEVASGKNKGASIYTDTKPSNDGFVGDPEAKEDFGSYTSDDKDESSIYDHPGEIPDEFFTDIEHLVKTAGIAPQAPKKAQVEKADSPVSKQDSKPSKAASTPLPSDHMKKLTDVVDEAIAAPKEVDKNGRSHHEVSQKVVGNSNPCGPHHMNFGGECFNCGWQRDDSKQVKEAWDSEMHTTQKDKGMWDGWTLAELKKEKTRLDNKENKSTKEIEASCFCYSRKAKEKSLGKS